MLGLVLGVLLLFAQEECINPLLVDGACPTPTEVVTLEPTETPTLRPTLAPIDTPTPRPTPTLRPTLEPIEIELPEWQTPTPRPTRMPGPDRALVPECLAAPPPLPEVPEILAHEWTPEERCGGTPEAEATRIERERPTPQPTPTPRPTLARPTEVVVEAPRELPTAEPTRTPLMPPVQLPE